MKATSSDLQHILPLLVVALILLGPLGLLVLVAALGNAGGAQEGK
jgi:hypothetical protein